MKKLFIYLFPLIFIAFPKPALALEPLFPCERFGFSFHGCDSVIRSVPTVFYISLFIVALLLARQIIMRFIIPKVKNKNKLIRYISYIGALLITILTAGMIFDYLETKGFFEVFDIFL